MTTPTMPSPNAAEEAVLVLERLDGAWAAARARQEATAAAMGGGESTERPPDVLTYSYLATFRSCRRMALLGYERRLEPIAERPEALRLGSAWHDAMEARDLASADPDAGDGAILAAARDRILQATRGGDVADPSAHAARQMRGRLLGMLAAYCGKWGVRDREFEPFAMPAAADHPFAGRPCVEMPFEGPIVNPATGAASRSFRLAGKVDEIVVLRSDPVGRPWLLERKTASTIDGGYLARLVLDLQLRTYAHYLREHVGINVAGAIYDVAGKPGLALGAGETEAEWAARVAARIAEISTDMGAAGPDPGETEAEFEARRAEAIAKSKTGKTSIKRKMPETEGEFSARVEEKVARWRETNGAQRDMPETADEYLARIAEWFEGRELAPGKSRFHREVVEFGDDSIDELREEIWELSKQILEARRRGEASWSRNDRTCFAYNSECRFWAICSAGRASAPMVAANLYRVRAEAHPELAPGGTDDVAPPKGF